MYKEENIHCLGTDRAVRRRTIEPLHSSNSPVSRSKQRTKLQGRVVARDNYRRAAAVCGVSPRSDITVHPLDLRRKVRTQRSHRLISFPRYSDIVTLEQLIVGPVNVKSPMKNNFIFVDRRHGPSTATELERVWRNAERNSGRESL